ncbi:uncharacterized protein LOC126744374 [Anthonomus grandis grandis]|uniref:uncharacterized protein LOC126744374 n=1 Tax=Anthonomus grandis grandis TaxID=2921223 RepID=UPI0021654EBD|nr:uncharacterized protein LOC126744374 [Anthonomus grandis grandis]
MEIFAVLAIFQLAGAELATPYFHKINQNPGLLPLKIGNAQNIADYWSFVEILDVSDIIKEFKSLENHYFQLQSSIKNTSTNYNHFLNSFNLIASLKNKINIQITQINPFYSFSRTKRGLINGLGSIVKSLTGNLDQNDAERYDNAINTITNNENKVKTLLKEQITIIEKSSINFINISKNLTYNQQILEKHIRQIDTIIKQIQNNNTISYGYFTSQIILSQVINAFQNIYDILENVGIAITFSKLNIFHPSIVNPNDLLNEIMSITPHLTYNKLPFTATLENLLLFEKIIEIKSYIKENKITFIIQVPIVEIKNYVLYRLYPLPVPFKNTFQIIISPNKYLLLNEVSYIAFDTKCQEITPQHFICKESSPMTIGTDPPCEVNLLSYAKKTINCQIVETKINNLKIQKLEEEKWMLITPNETIANQQCGTNKENIPLKGTYVLEFPPNCTIQIEGHLLRNYHLKQQTKFQNIQLPKLIFEANLNPNYIEIPPFKMDKLNLEDIENIPSIIAQEKEQLKEALLFNGPLHIQPISIWTLLIYIIILSFIGYQVYAKNFKMVPKLLEDANRSPSPEATTSQPQIVI